MGNNKRDKKKILILSLNYFPKYVGGAEVAVKEIVERMDKEKYEFHMLTLRFDSNLPKEEILHGIHIHRICFTKRGATIAELRKFPLVLNKYFFQMFGALYAWRLHRMVGFDAVWAIMAHSCGVPAGIFKMCFPKVKYILNLQEGDPPEYIENLARPFPKFLFPLNWISIWLFKNAFLQADIIHSLSTFLNSWAEKMGNKNTKIVVPNAVSYKKFSQDSPESTLEDLRVKVGKKSGETWLVTTSRLVHKNAVDNCIEAIAKLKAKNLSIHFAIIGVGPDEDKLKKLASDLGVSDRVHFLGEVQNSQIPEYLKIFDIFIRPSRSEGMGISFLEAMAARLPVVATTEGGISDFLFDKKTGWVCKKDDPDSIVKSVEDVLNSSELEKKNILDQAFNMVKEKYDWDIIAKKMDEEVFSVI